MKDSEQNSKVIKVPFVDLAAQYRQVRQEIMAELDRVLASGSYILGQTVAGFEEVFRRFCGTRFAVGVASGTDALILALKAKGIGPGDEVITVPNSFMATASSIVLAGATPVFVDVGDDYNMNPDLIDAAITPRTKALLPVHLTGRPADMHAILAKARKYGLAVIEDAAQAVGAMIDDQPVGSFGDAGCFSFHPLKNLNACGDGGMITTNDETLYEKLLQARNHGLRDRDNCDFFSLNSRLDAVQAAILSVKMRYVKQWNEQRRQHAAFYRQHLCEHVTVPDEKPSDFSVYQTFVVQTEQRNSLRDYLDKNGVDAKVHYPVPIHLQKAADFLGYGKGDFPVTEKQAQRILSLPVHPDLAPLQLTHTVETIRRFFRNQ